MRHLNGHLLCATDCETTGLIPGFHEVIQVTFVPLDYKLDPDPNYPIYDIYIRPDHPERFDSPYRKAFDLALEMGFERFAAADLFETWFDSLKLCEGKRIIMLGHELAFERDMYRAWLGREHADHFFDTRNRDTQRVAQFMNDWASFNAQEIPFPNKSTLRTVARKLGVVIEDDKLHDSAYDAWVAAQAYKKACTTYFTGGLV